MWLKNYKSVYFYILIFISIFGISKSQYGDGSIEFGNNNEFDVLIFTQRWPITACIEWMEKASDNVCILPSQKNFWGIHGIWPTRIGTMGPFFCNESATFDIDTLKPIMEQLDLNWLNIEKGKSDYSFWRHEWLKHGTCASVLTDLSTENKYFGQGLAWFQQYAMDVLLAKENIVPGSQYNITDFQSAIKKALNFNPSIHCIKEKRSGNPYVVEIRICFNRSLELVNCDGIKFYAEGKDNVITNCQHDEPVWYPNVVPEHFLDRKSEHVERSVWRFPWVNLYKLIQILKWFTL